MKIKTTPNITTVTTKQKKPRTFGFDTGHLFSYRGLPISEAQVEHMIEEMMSYPEDNPGSYSIADFYHKKFIAKSTYYDLLEKHPKLKNAHAIFMEKMGEKLWARSIEKKLDWNAVKTRMHRYNMDFHDDQKLQATILANARVEAENQSLSKGAGQTQYVVIKDPVYVEVEKK